MIDFTVLAATRLSTIWLLSVSLQACLVLPAPGEEDVFIDAEQIAIVRLGQSNKSDLQKNFGPPDWSFIDGSKWIYHTRDYRPAGLAVLTEVSAGSLMNWRSEFLYVYFDNFDVVDKVDISVVEPNPDDGWSKRKITDICIEAYGMPLLYGSASEDVDAKRFLTEPGKCAVYLYTETTLLPFLVRINLMNPARCPANDGYIRADLRPGAQEIAVISYNKFEREKYSRTPIEEKEFSGRIKFDCTPGDILFVRQHFGGRESFSFEVVSQEDGRRNIATRRLVLMQKPRLRSSLDH